MQREEEEKILNHNAMKMYDNSTIAQMAIVLLKQITTLTHKATTTTTNVNNWQTFKLLWVCLKGKLMSILQKCICKPFLGEQFSIY